MFEQTFDIVTEGGEVLSRTSCHLMASSKMAPVSLQDSEDWFSRLYDNGGNGVARKQLSSS